MGTRVQNYRLLQVLRTKCDGVGENWWKLGDGKEKTISKGTTLPEPSGKAI